MRSLFAQYHHAPDEGNGEDAAVKPNSGLSVNHAIVCLIALLPLATANAAEIFRCVGPDGQTAFQHYPCDRSRSSATATPTDVATDHAINPSSPPSATANRCEQVADAVRQIGDGFRVGETESVLRTRLTGRVNPVALKQGFAAFALAGSVPTEDLALFSQLICESQTSLPSPQPWHLNQNGIAIRLQGWQQVWHWPSSWRLVGVREQPGFQLELAYADFDAAHLRVGCRAHLSYDRLDGKGHQLLALWAEQLQHGASQQTPRHPGTLNQFGYRVDRDPTSKRELFRAQLPRADAGLQAKRAGTPEVSIALAPERICIMVRKGELADETMERQARALVELLLTKKTSPFAGAR